jgi:hypothetical protein
VNGGIQINRPIMLGQLLYHCQINSEIAIPHLKKLAQKYIGISNSYGFLTDLRNALGIGEKAVL